MSGSKRCVTIDNFDETKLSYGEIYAATKPVAYQKVPIVYSYPNGEGPLIVKTPNLFSFGVCENRDVSTDELTGYSLPFVCFDEREGPSEIEQKFIDMLEKITKFCKGAVDELTLQLKKGGRRKPINSDGLAMLKYRSDKPDAAPVLYAKMYTEKKDKKREGLKITSNFYRKRTEKDIKKGVKSAASSSFLVNASGHDYIKQKCRLIGGLRIEGVFIGAMIESIQVKLTEAVIIKKVPSFTSIMGDDLDLGSDHDSDNTSDAESEPEETPVKKIRKKQPCVIPEDEEEELDEEEDKDVTNALQSLSLKKHLKI